MTRVLSRLTGVLSTIALSAIALVAGALPGCAGPGQRTASDYPAAVGAVFRDAPEAPELVVIPAGSFEMGSTPEETTRAGRSPETAAYERPRRTVTIPRPLAIGRFLVTRAEYRAFVAATGRPPPPACNVLDGKWQLQPGRSFEDTAYAQTDRHPATCVDTTDAQAYAAWLTARTGHRWRLLHETEWEYAARAGSSTSRWWGDDPAAICAHANGADRSYGRVYPGEAKTNSACDDGHVQASPVDAFAPNPYGLHDMIGNVWQWTADCFVEALPDPQAAPAPADAGNCARRSIRGASWHNYPDALRAAARFWLPGDLRSSSVGFRVVRLPDAPVRP